MTEPYSTDIKWNTTAWAPLWNAWHYVATPEHRTWYDVVSKAAMRLSFADWCWAAPPDKAGQLFAPPKVVAVDRTSIGYHVYSYKIYCYPDPLHDHSLVQWQVYQLDRPRPRFRYDYSSVIDLETPAQSRAYKWDWRNFSTPSHQLWYAANSYYELYGVYDPPPHQPVAFVPRPHPGSLTDQAAANVPLTPMFLAGAFPSGPPGSWPPPPDAHPSEYYVNWRPPDNFHSSP